MDVFLLSDRVVLNVLKTHDIVWDVSSVKIFDVYISKTLLQVLNLPINDLNILKSLHNYNSAWYEVVKNNEKIINEV